MNLSNISNIIETYRPLPALDSLPFLVKIDNELKVIWFNFYSKETEKTLKISVESICITDESMNVKKIPTDIELSVHVGDFCEPAIGEQEYLKMLEDISNDYTVDKMKNLITKAELAPLFIAYDAVVEKVNELFAA